MGFVAPEAVLKQSTSIKDVIRDPQVGQPSATPQPSQPVALNAQQAPSVAAPSALNAPPVPVATSTPVDTPPASPVMPSSTPTAPISVPTAPLTPAQEQTLEPTSQPVSTPIKPAAEMNQEEYYQALAFHWNTLVDLIFEKVPTLKSFLKFKVPEMKEFNAVLVLKNEIQCDDFNSKKVEVLRYLRNNFDQRINDIDVVLEERPDDTKYVLTEDDKLDELRKQNPDMNGFINILNLRLNN